MTSNLNGQYPACEDHNRLIAHVLQACLMRTVEYARSKSERKTDSK